SQHDRFHNPVSLPEQRNQRHVSGRQRKCGLRHVSRIHKRCPLNANIPFFPRVTCRKCKGYRFFGCAKTRAINADAEDRDPLHGKPVQSRGWLPLSTCQNKGFPRVFSPLTRRQPWLTSGYQREFRVRDIPAVQGLKARLNDYFGGKEKTARLLAQADGSIAVRSKGHCAWG